MSGRKGNSFTTQLVSRRMFCSKCQEETLHDETKTINSTHTHCLKCHRKLYSGPRGREVEQEGQRPIGKQ